ncbi:MAG TPA: PAS domain-containing sensor histidine kinase [Polyangiaceae bacterium]|nr:PAS domain-containing sensor histidine kinase [Polyangiaceae bacterium]
MDLIDSLPHIVWTSDCNGAMNYANQRWVEYTGIGVEDAKGTGWLAALHLDDADGVAQSWQRAVRAGVAYEAECRLRRACDGSYRWHLCRALPEFDTSRRIVAWLGTCTDCDDLRRASSERDELIALAVHELRTPLTALKLRLEALARADGSKGKLQGRLENALEQALRVESLLQELVDASAFASGRTQIRTEKVELSQLTAEIVNRRRPEADRLGITIELDSTALISGDWDRDRVGQAISNLISEAFRHASGGSVAVQIARMERCAVAMVVGRRRALGSTSRPHADREEAKQSRRGGVSLGFHVARQIAQLHGGTLELSFQPEKGTALSMRLPLPSELSPLHNG